MILLPRQARDKHREGTQNRYRFLAGVLLLCTQLADGRARARKERRGCGCGGRRGAGRRGPEEAHERAALCGHGEAPERGGGETGPVMM